MTAIPTDLACLSEAELRKLENQIARKYSGRVPWECVIWAFGNLAVWNTLGCFTLRYPHRIRNLLLRVTCEPHRTE